MPDAEWNPDNDDDDEFEDDDDEDNDEPLTPEQEEWFRKADEGLARDKRKMAGRPRGYQWICPFGVFSIVYEADLLGLSKDKWSLCIKTDAAPERRNAGRTLGSYPDFTDAMLAVFNKTTGFAPWDKCDAEGPSDDKDWQSWF